MATTEQSGRDAEFVEFMAAAQPELLRMARFLTGSDDLARELTQDALVRAYAAWRRVRREGAVAYTRRIMAVAGRPNIHLEANGVAGTTYAVEWVDIDDPNPSFPYTPGVPAPTTNNDAISHVGDQGRELGAAHFSRLEGAVYDRGVVYWTSTQGGGVAETDPDTVGGYGNGHGQVWAFDPGAQRLTLVYQSPGPDVLDFPDNVTTSPRGTLILCEDNTNDNYLRGLTRKGELFDVALNRLVSITGADRSGDEFAGSTFSPGGGTLFVNVQASRGITYAIWGPWGRVGV